MSRRVCLNCGHPIDVRMDVIEWGGLKLDRPHWRAWYRGHEVHLTKTQFDIVEKLALAGGQLVPDKAFKPNPKSLKVHFAHIRNKMKALSEGRVPLESVYGVGHRWREAEPCAT